MSVHVFFGSFATREEACEYTEPRWEPEPDESVSDDEYADWEARNPVWRFHDELGRYLDSDFIETIFGDHRLDYLRGILADATDARRVEEQIGDDDSVLVLVFHPALGDFKGTMQSTSRLTYCGEFRSTVC